MKSGEVIHLLRNLPRSPSRLCPVQEKPHSGFWSREANLSAVIGFFLWLPVETRLLLKRQPALEAKIYERDKGDLNRKVRALPSFNRVFSPFC